MANNLLSIFKYALPALFITCFAFCTKQQSGHTVDLQPKLHIVNNNLYLKLYNISSEDIVFCDKLNINYFTREHFVVLTPDSQEIDIAIMNNPYWGYRIDPDIIKRDDWHSISAGDSLTIKLSTDLPTMMLPDGEYLIAYKYSPILKCDQKPWVPDSTYEIPYGKVFLDIPKPGLNVYHASFSTPFIRYQMPDRGSCNGFDLEISNSKYDMNEMAIKPTLPYSEHVKTGQKTLIFDKYLFEVSPVIDVTPAECFEDVVNVVKGRCRSLILAYIGQNRRMKSIYAIKLDTLQIAFEINPTTQKADICSVSSSTIQNDSFTDHVAGSVKYWKFENISTRTKVKADIVYYSFRNKKSYEAAQAARKQLL